MNETLSIHNTFYQDKELCKNENSSLQFVVLSPIRYQQILKTNLSYSSNQRAQTAISQNTRQLKTTNTTQKSTSQIDEQVLERLKNIQNLVHRNWQGIQADHSGKPGINLFSLTNILGTANILNKKKYNPQSENQLVDEDRFKLIIRMISKLREIDDERKCLSNHMNQENQEDKSSEISDFLNFKTIKENQLLSNATPSIAYAKSYNVETSDLLYKTFRGETRLIRSIFEVNGFTHTESHDWNILWSNSSCKSYLYEGLNQFQKINHFPSSNEITRKDKLCQNIVKMQEKFGKHHFDIIPDTYVLPEEFGEFYSHFQKSKQQDPKKNLWIVKPANLSRGRGIYIIDDVAEVIVDDISVISKYIANPLLINGHKFDLRIYVVVTSFEPLRIYVYKEGLARFASEQYNSKASKTNKFAHLTNYSINKKNENYIQNEDIENDDFGYKWSLSAFCKHLEQIGIDMNLFWSRIYDVIIKSIISGENHMYNAVKKTCLHKTNCFELFGYDILIDSDLKPWLIEINLSPSLACESPLDITIKSNLIADIFNMVGVKKYDRKKESTNKVKNRMKSYMNRGKSFNSRYNNIFNPLSDANQQNNRGGIFSFYTNTNTFQQENDSFKMPQIGQVIEIIDKIGQNDQEHREHKDLLKKLSTVKHKEVLYQTLLEYQRKGNFVRIYPSKGSDNYDMYFQQTRPLNKFIYKILYTDELIPNKIRETPKLNYMLDIPQSYQYYKNKLRENNNSGQIKEDSSEKQKNEEEKIQQKKDNQIQNQVKERVHQETQQKYLTQTNDNGKQEKEIVITSGQMSKTLIKLEDQSNKDSQKQSVCNEKILLTGDDVLIEYVERLINAIKQINDGLLKTYWKQVLEKFINHYVWNTLEKQEQAIQQQKQSLCHKLENRLVEMKERRRRLAKLMCKNEHKLQQFEQSYQKILNKKTLIVRKFTNLQLEHLLKTSTKNIALDIVQVLIPLGNQVGILVEMDQIYHFSNKDKQDQPKQVYNNIEKSISNAETEDDDLSQLKKRTSKEVINSTSYGNFFKEKVVNINISEKQSRTIRQIQSKQDIRQINIYSGRKLQAFSMAPKSAQQKMRKHFSQAESRTKNVKTTERTNQFNIIASNSHFTKNAETQKSLNNIMTSLGYSSILDCKPKIPNFIGAKQYQDQQLNRIMSGKIPFKKS